MNKQSEVVELQKLLDVTLEGLCEGATSTMPDGRYKRFFLWALSSKNALQQEWLQATGALQLMKLTYKLLGTFVDPTEWVQLRPYTVSMNVYQIFEIVSDNLAIGLAQHLPSDRTYLARKRLLKLFNLQMVDNLDGVSSNHIGALFAGRDLADCIDGFAQSLCEDKHREAASLFTRQFGGDLYTVAEGMIWPSLIANLESAVSLAQVTQSYASDSLVRQGLIDRYRAVNTLLDDPDLSPAQRLEVGADAILVVPTLAYYIAVLAETVHPLANYARILEDRSLERALRLSAMQVRLLNDLGTGLLTDDLQPVMAELREQSSRTEDIFDLLLNPPDPVLFTRIQKDLRFQEFNILLHDLDSTGTLDANLGILEDRLAFFAQKYQANRQEMHALLGHISDQLGDAIVSNLIGGFVAFHERLYSTAHTDHGGEYAV
jgi:hypothetical protein